jgi:hypothetical protein
MTTSTLGTPIRQRHKGWSKILVAGGAAVLAVAAGIGVWRTVDRPETVSTTVAEPAGAETATIPAPTAGISPIDASPTIYIVGSDAEATRVLEAIKDGNRILDQFGRPHFTAQVLVVASAEEAGAIVAAHAEINAHRASMGLAPIELIHLRAQ